MHGSALKVTDASHLIRCCRLHHRLSVQLEINLAENRKKALVQCRTMSKHAFDFSLVWTTANSSLSLVGLAANAFGSSAGRVHRCCCWCCCRYFYFCKLGVFFFELRFFPSLILIQGILHGPVQALVRRAVLPVRTRVVEQAVVARRHEENAGSQSVVRSHDTAICATRDKILATRVGEWGVVQVPRVGIQSAPKG